MLLRTPWTPCKTPHNIQDTPKFNQNYTDLAHEASEPGGWVSTGSEQQGDCHCAGCMRSQRQLGNIERVGGTWQCVPVDCT